MNRIDALRESMQHHTIDLVALGPGAHLAWLTEVRPHADERPLLFCVTKSYAGFLMPALEADSARQQTQLPFHTWDDNDGPSHALQDLLDAAKVANAESIVLDETMRADFAALIQDALPDAKRQFTASTIGALRMCKDNSEFDILKRNALTADEAMQQAWKNLQIGMTELEVAALVRDSFKQQKVQPLFTIVGAGGNGAFPHHQTGHQEILSGDIVVMDIGGGLDGYSSDITRMVSMGEPSRKYQQVHSLVEAAVQAAMDIAKPGIKAHELDDATRGVIKSGGFGEYFVHRTGHGLGVEIHEAPYITSTSQTVLEEGMVFSIEPGIYLPDEFGLRLEEIVILRSDGPEILSELPREVKIIEK